ncbi:FGGY family carbohydrate kinase [Asaia krungthepensis]|uniref:Carbohydrate kinase n=1 Tax=Asaia krungthepensis NRIC 0535 TaxID=1307925 RepID=A0ABQ0PZG4_9PROT|nr:FGGY family carbohydrate kinase [Asaia krungthepensis]GBQ85433.1 carbohydrate kinase [Asaia krungthepensis NRIC 0535]
MGFDRVAAGLDIGSTNLKAIIISPEGRVVGRAAVPTPRRLEDRMIDATFLLHEASKLLRSLCSDRYRIAAIATAGIGEDGMLVDSSLAPLSPALPWFDPQRHALYAAFAADLPTGNATGIVPDPFRTLGGWYWSARQSGHEQAQTWLAISDYPSAFWSSQAFMSDTLASRTAAYLPRTGNWVPESVAATLGNPALLPQVRRTGSIIGPVIQAGSGESPFSDDAVAVVGGHDHPIGGWGINQITPGAILDSMGTAEVIVTQAPAYPDPFPQDLDIAPGILSSGATLIRVEELARNLAWASSDEILADAIRALFAGTVQPDSFLDSSCFTPGSHGGHDPRFSADAPSSPLSRASAVVGALARIGADSVDYLGAMTQGDRALYISGGWSRAPGWVAIKQRFSKRPFRVVREPELTAASAALLAARAIGWAPSASDLLMPNSDSA